MGSYLISPIDCHIAVACDVDSAARAYQNPQINTVLLPSPLAHAFDYALAHLDADQIDACKDHLNLMRPYERASFKALLAAQQDLI